MVNRTRACAGSSVEAVEGISGVPAVSVRVKVIVTTPCALTVAAVICDTRPAPGAAGGIEIGVVVVVVRRDGRRGGRRRRPAADRRRHAGQPVGVRVFVTARRGGRFQRDLSRPHPAMTARPPRRDRDQGRRRAHRVAGRQRDGGERCLQRGDVDARLLLRLHRGSLHRTRLTGSRRLVQAEAHLEQADAVALSVEITDVAVRTGDALRRLPGGEAHALRRHLQHAVGAPAAAAGNQGGGATRIGATASRTATARDVSGAPGTIGPTWRQPVPSRRWPPPRRRRRSASSAPPRASRSP